MAFPVVRHFVVAVVLACLSGLSPSLGAHELRPAVADIASLAGNDGLERRLQIQLRVNVEALIAGIGIEHDDTDESPQAVDYDALRALEPSELQARLDAFLPTLTSGMTLVADTGERLAVNLSRASLPAVGDVRVARDSTLELSAPLPDESRSFTWAWQSDFGPVIVRSAESEGPDAFSVYLLVGDISDPLPIGSTDDAVVNGEDATTNNIVTDASSTGQGAPAGTFSNYLRVGFVHIVPLGLDHILFVIGLFLLAPRAKPILWQVTTFTLAHSITLACATLGWINVSASIVEPLIALSIVAICIENLLTTQLHRWRLLVVFGFGLLHGLGFASVLQDVGGSATAFLTTLIAFNIGVELGQLLVVALCFLLAGCIDWNEKTLATYLGQR